GSVKLDLRQAEIAGSNVLLHVQTVIGSIKIWIPKGVPVEVEGETVLGSRSIDEEAPSFRWTRTSSNHELPSGPSGAVSGPLLRLRADTVVGSVKVYRV